MDGNALQDRIAKGLGVAARRIGNACIVYRPRGWREPIVEGNRVIRLCAAFQPETRGLAKGEVLPIWHGVFDSAYTQVGDYLVGGGGTYFICSQAAEMPLLCALTNRVVSLTRPGLVAQGSYSGAYVSEASCILEGWPASVMESGSVADAPRAGQAHLGGWTVLLPPLPITPRVADIMTDEAGSAYVVGAAAPGALGWRLSVRQVGA